ncbi:Alpha/Beta hydrolase protein [Tuber indicum]|nr:Alpha/Beta hydrolase protein [Tuber indicum]
MASTTETINPMRHDTEFKTLDGTTLRGWFYPAGENAPAVVISHGFACLKSWALPEISRALQSSGIASLLYDQRCFGTSSGTPRHDVDPELQCSDVHDAVGHLLSLPSVNPDKIGIVGFSYSAAHAVKAASLDRRIKSIISINSFIRGSWLLGLMVPDRPSADALIWEDRERRRAGDGEFYQRMQKVEIANGREWENRATIQSLLKIRKYSIMEDMKVLAPTSLLIIVDESVLGSGEYQKAFEAAGEGGEIIKEFLTVEGGHFDPMTEGRGLENVIKHSVSFLRRIFYGEVDE